MSDSVDIRSLTIEDLADCQTYFPEPIINSYRTQISRQSASGYTLYGLFSGGSLAAICHIRRQGPNSSTVKKVYQHPELGNLHVLPGCRRNGYAQKLLLHIENMMRKEHYKSIGLVVSDQNIAARQLYTKLGYRHQRNFPASSNDPKTKRLYYLKEI